MFEGIRFLLVPDRSAARRVRRVVAEDGGRLGVVVGGFPELLDLARDAFLLPPAGDDWGRRFREAAESVPDAFYAESMAAAPEESAAEVERAFLRLREALDPGTPLAAVPRHGLPARAGRRLRDLAALEERLCGALPPVPAACRALLAAPPDRATSRIAVHRISGRPPLPLWREAVVRKLGEATDGALLDLLRRGLDAGPAAEPGCSLGRAQRDLFAAEAEPRPGDDTVRCLLVRDPLLELEVAAGIIAASGLPPSGFGLLLPQGAGYRFAAEEVFGYAGIPLADLRRTAPVRDLGREAVHAFLSIRCGRAAAMERASLLSSPLMPWPVERGMSFAQTVMDGRYGLKAPKDLPEAGRRMLDLLRSRSRDAAGLTKALRVFAAGLADGEDLGRHRAAALATVEELAGALHAAGAPPWDALAEIASPRALAEPAPETVLREAVAVFSEDEEPWRPVRELLVAGFSAGRYPTAPRSSPVFSDREEEALRDAGFALESAEETLARRRALFGRQLGAASERATLLVPRRDGAGERLSPSGTLAFLARLTGRVDDPAALLRDLEELDGDGAEALGLPAVPDAPPEPRRRPPLTDLDFGRDLRTLWKYEGGGRRPESPSSLETLLLSPLAWLFDRAAIAPRAWAPEALDPASKGTLAHDVFEHLFPAESELPSAERVREGTVDLLADAVRRLAPYLAGEEFRVEREHLAAEVRAAAEAWRLLMRRLGGRVVATEIRLEGRLEDLPITGIADAVVALPDGDLYVVDYKKSSSGKRRDRMAEGYDSQTSLYRKMLRTGGPREAGERLRAEIIAAKRIGVLYYTMNDRIALADTEWRGGTVAGLDEVPGEISARAIAGILARLAEVGEGRVSLPRERELTDLGKAAGLILYALEDVPLLRLLVVPAGEEAAT